MNIRIQGGHKDRILQMLFLIQYTLIQVSNGPAKRDIEVEQFCQLISCLLSIGISPGLERRQKLSILIQRDVAMHHGTDSHRTVSYRSDPILLLDILSHCTVAALQSCKDLFLGVSPDSVDQGILPAMAACCKHCAFLIDQHSLDIGRTELDTERSLSVHDHIFYVCHI